MRSRFSIGGTTVHLLVFIVSLNSINISLAIDIASKDYTVTVTRGLLYPTESEFRQVRLLDGIWNFVKSDAGDPMQGVRDAWFRNELNKARPTIPMPVPASYNDINTDYTLRDHVGTVWYERKFFVPNDWALDQRVWLRFGSVHYAASVWFNGEKVVYHEIGHLPFEVEITAYISYGAENRLTVLCDNTLLNTTIPQGKVSSEPGDNGYRLIQSYSFDFFNYAGIHRSVHVYTTPRVYIEDIAVTTELSVNNTGVVDYVVSINGKADNEFYDQPARPMYVHVQMRSQDGDVIASDISKPHAEGRLIVPFVRPWWPYLMHPEPGYLYTLEVYLHAMDKSLIDVYRLKVGIRSLHWDNSTLMINGRPVYMRGFGRHEDSDIRGKGFDYALLVRDFNLLQWIGANAYRTSHYPYSEESMQFADAHGIMIIDECPSVNTENFNTALRLNHQSSLEQLIHRDRNHPSVVMWSVANEPRSASPEAAIYFSKIVNYTKSLDPRRPVTASLNVDSKKDKLGAYLDIISFNRYNAWYHGAGDLNIIVSRVVEEATLWHELHNKPVLMSEYGAGTLEGMHFLPTFIWSEEFQAALMTRHFRAFDILRQKKWFIGEFVWNFADFKTAQSTTRIAGNKKGVFTRNRQPKGAAHLLRQRYFGLCSALDLCEVPEDVFQYIINWNREEPVARDYSEL